MNARVGRSRNRSVATTTGRSVSRRTRWRPGNCCGTRNCTEKAGRPGGFWPWLPRSAALPDGSTVTFARPYHTDTAQLIRDGNTVVDITDLERAQIAYEIVRTPAPVTSPAQRHERHDRTGHHSSAALLGVTDGVALIRGDVPGDPGDEELRLYDITTGDVLATVADFDGYARATAAPRGRIVVIAAAEDSALDNDRLIIFRPDGRTTITTVGDTDFWGRPRSSVATP